MKFKVIVVNMKRGDCDFRCDRQSVLGNPHPMKEDTEAERNRVCEKYWNDMVVEGWDKPQLEYLRKIWRFGATHGSVRLGCWCSPARCHCDTVKWWLESHME